MPDQQAGAGRDPWEAAEGHDPDQEAGDTAVPDTDEAGTGLRGAPSSGAVHPEAPPPDEPSA
ncbi:hypothetical protein [Streptomyces humi]|uniref:hypothetical protein n=1 Tax=Streptomyces humi TaxID=1428620 RepID=UPI00062884D7|nr:hypothetical protein [Streptomyces humi]